MKDRFIDKDVAPEAEVTGPVANEFEPAWNNAWDFLASIAGTLEGPEDWSEQHEHYVYGTPKA